MRHIPLPCKPSAAGRPWSPHHAPLLRIPRRDEIPWISFHAAGCMFLLAFLFAASAPAQQPEALRAEVSGDSVTLINENIYENCASCFAVDVEVNGFSITVTERDTIGVKATCSCYFTLTTIVRGLPAGAYTAEVRREYKKKYLHWKDTTIIIGRLPFDVVRFGPGTRAHSRRQSDCITSGVAFPADTPLLVSVTPNPIRDGAMLLLDLDRTTPVTVELYTKLGQRIRRYEMGNRGPGAFRMPIAGTVFTSSGQYFCRVFAGGRSAVAPIFVLR